MGGAFSSSKKQTTKPTKKPPQGTVSEVDRAILDLKNSRDRLNRYKKKLEQDEEKMVMRAKQAKERGDTKTALGLLRLRKYKLRELETTEGKLLTLFQMVQTIDSKQNEAQLLAAMKSGKDALKQMHQETTVDDVLELMEQIQEEHEVEAEINGILSDVPSLSVEDEAAVEAELEELLLQQKVDTLPDAPTTQPLDLPVAPTTNPTQTTTAQPEKRVAVPS